MEGGRHVQTETVRKVVREAHEAREERDRENARPQPKRPRDRRGARQVALDRDQGGGGAPLRHRAALALRRARARGPLGGPPQARRMAEVLQRLLAQEGLRLLEEAQGVLQRQEGAGGSRRRALVEQIRDRRDRGGRRRQARGHQGRPRARAPPQQIAATTPGLSASTVYRWVDAGYDGMANMELRRKVGYRPRSHRAPRRATHHSARRSHAAFLALGEDACAAAWEMDTVEGARGDSARLLTLLHRPSRFQLALPLPDGACASVLAALSSLRGVLGEDGARRAFGAVLTDNGSEFADEGAIAALLGERDGETRLFYCDPRQSQQKGACEKNHVEIRKLLPKGAGARFDRLTAADCALLMSQVNSEPRGALGFLTPARVLRMALGEDASALMDAFGVEELAPGELDLTPGCIDRARAARGEGPLAG